MASVDVRVRGGQIERLPDVCICCGAPATTSKEWKFTFYPLWTRLLAPIIGGVILMMFFKQDVQMEAPLCKRHKNYRFWHIFTFLGGLFGLFALFPVAIFLSVKAEQAFGKQSGVPVLFTLGYLVALFGGLIGMAVWARFRTIGVTGVKDGTATLRGVAARFAESVQDGTGRGYYTRQREAEPRPASTIRHDAGKIRHVCPTCDETVFFPARVAGMMVRCPECSDLVDVPR